MRTLPADFRFVPPRHSPGVLAGVILVHAGILAMILAMPRATKPVTPPAPLYVRLIEPAVEQREPTPRPQQPKAIPPQPPQKQALPPPPVLAATRPAPRPDPVPVLEARRPDPVEPPRPDPQSAPAPAAVANEAPRPAPPLPLPLVQPRFNADYLDNPKPPYPTLSRRMGEEGEVRLRVYVDPAGNAQQVELLRTSGHPRLDQSALETVKRWRFVPARQGDQPVAAWVIVPIQFTLRS